MTHRPSLTLALTMAGATLIPTMDALACGGFFCSSVPIDQSKERIVFAIDEEEEKVETHVQIFYQGAAEEFAWVVPVPKQPEVGLSTDSLFNQLQWRTAPQFLLNWQEIGDCTYDDMVWLEEDVAAGAFDEAADGGGGGVQVVEQQQVGPYDQVTLQASSSAALLDWLQANDYVLPDSVESVLAPYVDESGYFVALKLASNRDAGDIAPIKMTYDGNVAGIPLVLTSIAATPDMRIEPYIFANGKRGVPDNYLHVQINEAAVNWLSGGANYDDVVTLAANEAGGHAFATDFSGPTESLVGSVYREGQFDLEVLGQTDDPARFVSLMLGQGFPQTAAVQNIIRHYIPMPAELAAQGVSEQQFYNQLEAYGDALEGQPFDAAAFAATLEEVIVTPLIEAESLFERFDTVTRLTSSMSPEEMDVDPYFVLNGDMGPVENQRWADLVVDCTGGIEWSQAPRYLELSDGRQILLPPEEFFWSGESTTDEFFADLGSTNAEVIEQTSATGLPTVISDQGEVVDEEIDEHNDDVAGTLPFDPRGEQAAGCGCSSASPAGGAWVAGLMLWGLVGRRRRA